MGSSRTPWMKRSEWLKVKSHWRVTCGGLMAVTTGGSGLLIDRNVFFHRWPIRPWPFTCYLAFQVHGCGQMARRLDKRRPGLQIHAALVKNTIRSQWHFLWRFPVAATAAAPPHAATRLLQKKSCYRGEEMVDLTRKLFFFVDMNQNECVMRWGNVFVINTFNNFCNIVFTIKTITVTENWGEWRVYCWSLMIADDFFFF